MTTIAAIDIGTLAGVVGAGIAALSILGPARAWYRRGPGRRSDLYARLARLGVGAHQTFFEDVIGALPAIRRTIDCELPGDVNEVGSLIYTNEPVTLTIWVDPLFYAQTVSDQDGTVLGFSITTRSRRFAPRFSAPRPVPTWRWWIATATRGRVALPALAQARLGRTRFPAVVREERHLPSVRGSMGAHFYEYSESWSWGNPGFYCDYVCTVNMASAVSRNPQGLRAIEWPRKREDDHEGYGSRDGKGNPTLADWITTLRTHAVVDTWTVIKWPLSADRWPTGFGPNIHEVRTLP